MGLKLGRDGIRRLEMVSWRFRNYGRTVLGIFVETGCRIGIFGVVWMEIGVAMR